ncbi:MAG: hypothetical protein DCC49_07885 [Acidobacteria bacterium]|nr:MAG: hypothetical protein DCC49_07885 [Acidobacteriota bacterium]
MTELAEKIFERIRAHGPIDFAQYMDAALYDEDYGFFMRPGRGPGADEASDFITSPEISPMFGAMLARYAGGLWESMGRPASFDVVEAGGGRGSLAEAFVDAAALEPWFDSLRYRIIDPIHRGESRQVTKASSRIELEGCQLEGPVAGLIFANELLDNIPERLWRFDGDEWRELKVGLNGEDLCMVDGERASPDLVEAENLCIDLSAPRAGEVRVGSAGALEWVKAAAEALVAGELLLIDYGDAPSASPFGGIRTFCGHTRGADPLEAPGEQDITLPINWMAISRAAESAGLVADHPTTQAEWLGGLGLAEEIASIREFERLATNSKESFDALGFRDRRMRAISLIDPAGLGAFTVFRARKGC